MANDSVIRLELTQAELQIVLEAMEILLRTIVRGGGAPRAAEPLAKLALVAGGRSA
jgi:hypothetical protein